MSTESHRWQASATKVRQRKGVQEKNGVAKGKGKREGGKGNGEMESTREMGEGKTEKHPDRQRGEEGKSRGR